MNAFPKFELKDTKDVNIVVGYRYILHDVNYLFFIDVGDADLFMFTPVGSFSERDDSFFIQMSENDHTFLGDLLTGTLDFICNIGKGELVFPFELVKAIAPKKVILRANENTVLKKIRVSELEELSKNPNFFSLYSELSDKWIINVSKIYEQIILTRHPTYLNKGINKKEPKNSSLAISKHKVKDQTSEIFWIKVIEGSVSVAGVGSIVLNPKSNYFPVTPSVWLDTLEETILEVKQPLDRITATEYFELIKKINSNLINFMIDLKSNDEAIEDYEIKLRDLIEEKRIIASNAALEHILDEKVGFQTTHFENSIFQVCEIIGHVIKKSIVISGKTIGKDFTEATFEIACSSKIQTRNILLTNKWWKNGLLPLAVEIDNVNDIGYAALLPKNGYYNLVYPQDTSKYINLTKDIIERIKPIAVMFYKDIPKKIGSSFPRIIAYFAKDSVKDIILILIFSFIANLITLFIPFFSQMLFDKVIPSTDLNLLSQLTLGLFLVAITTSLFMLTREYIILRIQAMLSHNIEAGFWIKLLTLPLHFFRKYSFGELFGSLSSITEINKEITGYLSGVMINGLFSFVYLAAMVYYSPVLSLMSTFIIFFFAILMSVIFFYSLKIEKDIEEETSICNGKIVQIIEGISKIRIYAAENRIYAYWFNSYSNIKHLELKKSTLQIFVRTLSLVMPSFVGLMIVLMVLFLFQDEINGKPFVSITVGEFVAFNTLALMLILTFFNLVETFIYTLHVIPKWQGSKPILEEQSEYDEDKVQQFELKGKVELSQVYFRYDADSPYIHRKISLYAEPGELIAIVGNTGCGKSTIIKLILGFERPESGGVFVDDHDLTSLDLQYLRTQIGVVSQNSKLVEGTIRENIVGRRICSDAEVMQAVKLACLTELIEELPLGLDTVVSQGCEILLGGQLQRIFIARALVHKPKILIFDEATNALDNITQNEISLNIEALHVTRIVIAHDIRTIMSADRIYVIKYGTVVETGRYAELINQNGYFAKLFESKIL